MTTLQIIGIDPGPTPGFVLLRPGDPLSPVHVVQCTAAAAAMVLSALLRYDEGTPALVGIERFVVGRSSMRSAGAGEVTRSQIGQLREVWEAYDSTSSGRRGGHWFERSAANVKPWATDARLQACALPGDTSLWLQTAGMRHARDAARHCLYAAVHDGGFPDPLSKKATHP